VANKLVMTLPFPPRRSHLSAFWLALNLGSILASSGLALGLGFHQGIVALPVAFIATAAIGLIWRDGPLFLYRVWNKAAQTVARVGQWWVLAVTYYLVLSVTARGGSRLDLVRRTGSMWKAYGDGNGTRNVTGGTRRGWASRFAREARGRERAWWISVLPLLLVVSLFGLDSKDEDVPSNIYTLY
jgi:hypothetical protein